MRRCFLFVEKFYSGTVAAVVIALSVSGALQNSALAQETLDEEFASKARHLARIRSSHLAGKDPRLVSALKDLAERAERLDLYRKSLELYRECLRLEERAYGKSSFDLIPTLSDLSWVCTKSGGYAEARFYAERVLALHEKKDGVDSYNCGVLSGQLGKLSEELGDFEQAQKYFERQLSCAKKSAYPYSPLTRGAFLDLERFYEVRGNYLACGITHLHHAENERLASSSETHAMDAYSMELFKAGVAFGKYAKGVHRPWWQDALNRRSETLIESIKSLGGSR